jgi:hypothetical protein
LLFDPPLGVFGVGQAAILAAVSIVNPSRTLPRSMLGRVLPVESSARQVGHEVQSLPDVRRPEARSAQIRRPDGVTRSFQVRRNNVEPSKAVFGRNLLAKDCVRAALANEPEPCRP